MTPTPLPVAVSVVTHPLVLHKLTLLRQQETSTSSFRSLLVEISMLMAYEVTRDLPLVYEDIQTPICAMRAPRIDGKKVVLVSVLRAGNGMLDGMLRILPSARVGHVGPYRDPETLEAVEYYLRMPRELATLRRRCDTDATAAQRRRSGASRPLSGHRLGSLISGGPHV